MEQNETNEIREKIFHFETGRFIGYIVKKKTR
jgi:hypothetical protein